ncbi:MAG TPA: hypothetical protein DGH68_08935 [Bacteroidetes bacterium]|jgi:peroxiredoxin|nr:hypothetical protein [Bacteroidota bacterium]
MSLVKNRSLLTTSLLVVAILVLVVQNFLIVRKNDQYLKRIERLSDQVNRLTVMSEGDSVHSFVALSMDSASVLIDPAKQRRMQAMLVFTTWCGACVKNIGPWQKLVPSLQAMGVEVFGVSPDSLYKLNQYRSKCVISFPVYSVVHDSSVLSRYKLHSFPQTILIDSLGLVKQVWAGVLSDDAVLEIQHRAGKRSETIRK